MACDGTLYLFAIVPLEAILRHYRNGRRKKGVYAPSEEEIRKATIKIQEGWTDAERIKRYGVVSNTLYVPEVEVGAVIDAAAKASI